MTTKEQIKKAREKTKRLSVYTEEERELTKYLLEEVGKVYVMGWEERKILEEKFLKVIRRNKWKSS